MVSPDGTGMGLREIAADFDPTGGTDHRNSPTIGPFLNFEIRQSNGTTTILTILRSTQTTDQIYRSQMCVSLQHSQLFMARDRAHLGNIEPALE